MNEHTSGNIDIAELKRRVTRRMALDRCLAFHPAAPCGEPCDQCWQRAEAAVAAIVSSLGKPP